MPGAEGIRLHVQRLVRAVPFRPFALNLNSGERVIVEYAENIAFDPATGSWKKGWDEFYVFSEELRLFSKFAAVDSVALLDPDKRPWLD